MSRPAFDEQVRHALRGAPRRRVASLHGGDVRPKLVGRAVALGEPLIAPLTRRPCLYWDVWRGGQLTRLEWQQFMLWDGASEARILLADSPRVCVFRTVFDFGDGERVEEGVLRAGDLLAVQGELSFEAITAQAGGYRQLAPRRPVVTAAYLAKDGTVLD